MPVQGNAPVTLDDQQVLDLASAVVRLHQWADGVAAEPGSKGLNSLLALRLAEGDLPRLTRLVAVNAAYVRVCTVCAGRIREGQPWTDEGQRGGRHTLLEQCRSALRAQIRSTVDHATGVLALLHQGNGTHDTHLCGTRGSHCVHVCDCGHTWTSDEPINHTAPEPTEAPAGPAAWPAGVTRVVDPAVGGPVEQYDNPAALYGTGVAGRALDDMAARLAEPVPSPPTPPTPHRAVSLLGALAARQAKAGVPLAESTLPEAMADLAAVVAQIRSTVDRLAAVADHMARLMP